MGRHFTTVNVNTAAEPEVHITSLLLQIETLFHTEIRLQRRPHTGWPKNSKPLPNYE